MNLTRPLVSLDLEATGTDPATDRIVEVGIVKRYPDGRDDAFRWLVNPEVQIPAESIRVHGYTNEIRARSDASLFSMQIESLKIRIKEQS